MQYKQEWMLGSIGNEHSFSLSVLEFFPKKGVGTIPPPRILCFLNFTGITPTFSQRVFNPLQFSFDIFSTMVKGNDS